MIIIEESYLQTFLHRPIKFYTLKATFFTQHIYTLNS